ncbi:MAG: metalloregulator ArsR/SmtB family transcription factor [Chloroflexi bacterium]|nr:metalloregulator ArsR/SmtB family transcription factor [Chloroflexota bacterium]
MSKSSAVHRFDPDSVAPLFAALGDPTRLQLVNRLSSGGRESIASLSENSSMSRQAVTKHLKVLEDAGLVRNERRGRERLWQFEPARFDAANVYLARISMQWDDALNRLKNFLEN